MLEKEEKNEPCFEPWMGNGKESELKLAEEDGLCYVVLCYVMYSGSSHSFIFPLPASKGQLGRV